MVAAKRLGDAYMAIVLMYHNVVESDAVRDTFHPAHRPYVTTREEFAASTTCSAADLATTGHCC
jgi:hypothetical protein